MAELLVITASFFCLQAFALRFVGPGLRPRVSSWLSPEKW